MKFSVEVKMKLDANSSDFLEGIPNPYTSRAFLSRSMSARITSDSHPLRNWERVGSLTLSV
jgi:hypothetical protein